MRGGPQTNIGGNHLTVWYHGSPTGFPGTTGPIHVGTQIAARQALEARIGVPADLQGWNGNREYGKTLLAGTDKLESIERGETPYYDKYPNSGYNVDAPKEDYYPTKMPTMGWGAGATLMTSNMQPAVRAYQIAGPMGNRPDTPYSDTQANGLAKAQQTRGGGKHGFYYKNIGEDSGSISAVVPNRNHLSGQMG
jgi:hypothetical protein